MVIDGEHYPPVVAAALAGLRRRFEVVGGLFAGGREKLRGGAAAAPQLAAELGLPRLDAVDPLGGEVADVLAAVRAALAETGAEALVDLSDEPVIGYRERFLLMSAALAEGARYVAADTELWPQKFAGVAAMPSLGVIGTGKRVGKTAVSGWLARRLDARLRACGGVIVVAMGRGGPPEPELIAGGDGLGPAELLAASRAGLHAASDCYEDAVLAGVPAVGCRRCGGGLAGMPFDDNVRAALPLVETSGAALAVFEGSGSVVPPVACDAALCVAGASQPAEYVTGYLGTYRLLLSDVLVLTQCEAPFADAAGVRALAAAARAVAPGLEVVPVVFRPRPAQPVRGRRVAFFTTAPEGAAPRLARALAEDHGAEVVLVCSDLADRARLAPAVARAAREADVFLTEIKAAAVDVVAEGAAAAGRELVFCDNEPVALEGDLGAAVDGLAELAAGRFTARTAADAPHEQERRPAPRRWGVIEHGR
ncbi:MAG TPA: 2,3-diphosphoglycerate synthetase [Thermoleophilia bacterium]|nr:2,3-diphosphoglycerate synthetase [Thermoleophilia bacterium]